MVPALNLAARDVESTRFGWGSCASLGASENGLFAIVDIIILGVYGGRADLWL